MNRNSLFLTLTAAAVLGLATVAARPIDPDDEAIAKVIQHYFNGGMDMRQAFYPQANMWYVRDGELVQVPIEDFLTRVEANAGEQSDQEVRKTIVSIDRFKDAAVAKLELKRPNSVIYDYMSLMKADGEWIIVNKTFARERSE